MSRGRERSSLGGLAEVALVAGLARREVGRRPGAWVATALTGVLFAGLLLLVGVVSQQVQERADDRSFEVAVGGDVAGAGALVARLDAEERLVVVDVDDPQTAVTDRDAAVGVSLPRQVDATVAAGDPVELRLSYRTGSPTSFEALVTVLAVLQEAEIDVLLSDREPRPAPVALRVDSVLRDQDANRSQLADQVAAVAALLCLGVVTAVAGVLGGARERRALEPLLVLPLRRRSIAAGVAAGTLPVAALQVVAGVALLVLTAAVPWSTARQPLDALVPMLVAGVAASLLLAVLGCAVGAVAGSVGTGTEDAVSLGDLLGLPFVVVGVVLFAVPDLAATPLQCAVPGLGQALVVRLAVAGELGAAQALAASASCLLSAAALVAVAGHLLGDERRLLRATR